MKFLFAPPNFKKSSSHFVIRIAQLTEVLRGGEFPLSATNGRVSCGTCHVRRFALTDRRAVSKGIDGQLADRNAMPLFNVAWKSHFFWDGRASSLREQVLLPIQDPK